MATKKKDNTKLLLIVFGIITVLILCVEFVFSSEVRDNVKAAPTAWNVIGFILTAGSWFPLWKASRITSDDDATKYCIAWAVMIVLGIFASTGFYGYTY